MSGPHRGLPPPAAMGLSQPSPPGGSGAPPPPLPGLPAPGQVPPPPPPLPPSAQQPLSLTVQHGPLPPPPSWQAVSEESMRSYLTARAEEERRRQEEERTRQEMYRVEQRRIESDMFRSALQAGVPPAMVPLIFTTVFRGPLPQSAQELLQQYAHSQSQQVPPPALLPGSPSIRSRGGYQAAPYGSSYSSSAVSPSSGLAQTLPSGYIPGHPASPSQIRFQALTGQGAHSSGGGAPQGHSITPSGTIGTPPTLSVSSGAGHVLVQQQQPAPPQRQQQHQHHQPQQQQLQHQTQRHSTLSFCHWEPPGGQPGISTGESPRKRKATAPQSASAAFGASDRFRSPPRSPPHHRTRLSNPPMGRRRGHMRQQSDLGIYRPESGTIITREGVSVRAGSPLHTSEAASARESGETSSTSSQPHIASRGGAHSVSSLLVDERATSFSRQYMPGSANVTNRPGESETRVSPSLQGDAPQGHPGT
ncbi:hypothetical protein VTK73DRAFT_10007 [Phialemonium thermophilum]|uniref:Uncharacterized protein n=1 Tax=Phialemonium thermophilum TaxID=223376 RepID=A0ABR3Y467_9PEZI